MPNAKFIKNPQTNALILPLGLKVGSWNELTFSDSSNTLSHGHNAFRAPHDAEKLLVFSEHLLGWLPNGRWKIIQIDNSTALTFVTASPIARLLLVDDADSASKIVEQSTLLFEYCESQKENDYVDVLLTQLMFQFLVSKSHIQIVSSDCTRGQFLSIQDGYVYLLDQGRVMQEKTDAFRDAEKMGFTQSPSWVLDLLTRWSD